jgi:peptide/nickel transport system permease protein
VSAELSEVTVLSSRRAPRRARLNSGLIVAAASLSLIFCACLLGPIIWTLPAPVDGSILAANAPLFAPGHLLGTDVNGNDVLARLLHGGRASLVIAIAVNALGLFIGGLLGAVSGYVGGIADAVLMRVLDVLIAFPSIVLAIAIAQALGPSLVHTVWALALFSVPAFARVARSATLKLRQRPFMLAAELAGSGVSTLARHIAPNILPQLVELATLGMGIAITIEGALSFIGLGVPPPGPSWGNMIFQGQQALLTRPALVLLPSALLLFTVLSFNLLARAVRSSRTA